MTGTPWQVRWEQGAEGPYRVGVADPPSTFAGQVSHVPRTSVLFLMGRGDSLELRTDIAERLTVAGARVVAVEHVGQGASPGLGRSPDAVHVDSFTTHVAAALGEADRLTGPAMLLGHSMGGLIAAHLLAARPRRFDSAVLTSPMWGWPGGLPAWLAGGLSTLAMRSGRGTAFAAGEHPFSTASCVRMRGAADDQVDRLLHFSARNPELVRGGSTWSWIHAASRSMRQLADLPLHAVRTGVTVISCAADESVSLPAHGRLTRRFPGGRVIRVAAGHDPFFADSTARSRVWDVVEQGV